MKKVKVKINIGRWQLQDFLLTKILSQLCIIQEVEDREDIFIHSAFQGNFNLNKKTIVVSGEPLFLEYNVMNKIMETPFICRFTYWFYRYMPASILNIKRGYIRPWYVGLLSEMQQHKYKNIYAVICNDTKAEHVFNMPYFILQLDAMTKEFQDFTQSRKITIIPPKFCCAVVSNPFCVERNEFYKILSKYKKIDIYGRHFLNNADNHKISSFSDFTNHNLFREYKFVICFENSYTNEYITNKLVEPMLANSIPVYRGAGNTGNYFNTKSFINYDDYGNYDKMMARIIELDRDDEQYKSFLEQPWMTAENKAYIETKKHSLKDFLKRIVEDL